MNWLRNIIYQWASPPPFKFSEENMKRMWGHYLEGILKKVYPDAEIRIADRWYTINSFSETVRWLEADSLDKMRYLKTVRDCDDFARESRCRMMRLNRDNTQRNWMYAYCEGNTPEGYHAFNLVVDNNLKIWIIEPQNDTTCLWKTSEYRPDFIQF